MKTFEDAPKQESDDEELEPMPSYEELQQEWKEQKEAEEEQAA